MVNFEIIRHASFLIRQSSVLALLLGAWLAWAPPSGAAGCTVRTLAVTGGDTAPPAVATVAVTCTGPVGYRLSVPPESGAVFADGTPTARGRGRTGTWTLYGRPAGHVVVTIMLD